MKKIKINTDRILGISAMVISLLTLIIFIYQTNIMREQSKLSVKPRLDFTTFQTYDDSTVTFQDVLINKGLGPAIIDSIYFVYQDDAHSLNTERFMDAKLPLLLDFGRLTQHSNMGKGSSLTPGEQQSVYTYQLPISKLDSVLEYLNIGLYEDVPFSVEVIYTSIYEDEVWKLNSNDDEPITLEQ